jgi:ketosteroid isomerase-like protein
MKRLVALLLVLVLQAAASGQQPPGKPDPDREVRQQAERYFDAIERRDVKTLDDLLLQECMVCYPRNVVDTKEKLLETMRKPQPAAEGALPSKHTLSDVKVRRVGDTVVLIGTLAIKHGDAPEVSHRRTLTWARQDGRWRLLHDQWSLLGDSQEAEFWSSYFHGRNQNFNRKPNALLVKAIAGVRPGKALDAGIGEGRNAICLARNGWDVTGFDRAEGALAVARQQARERGLRITPILQSDEEFDWGHERWDLVALLYFSPVRDNLAKIRDSIKPGGLVVIEAFLAAPDKPSAGVNYKPGELRKMFEDGFQILRYEETEGVADYGQKRVKLVRLVGAKTAVQASSCLQATPSPDRRIHARQRCRGR